MSCQERIKFVIVLFYLYKLSRFFLSEVGNSAFEICQRVIVEDAVHTIVYTQIYLSLIN